MKIDRILLDMDGVIADWVGQTCTLFGEDREELEKNWGDEWDITSMLNISGSEMWKKIDEAGVEFWSEIKPYPWMEDLWKLCNERADTHILTTPSACHHSSAGKVLWMDKHLNDGKMFRKYNMSPVKEICAHPNVLLIDDSDSNCEKFRAAGGQALVFPRAWNSKREYKDDPMKFVEEFFISVDIINSFL